MKQVIQSVKNYCGQFDTGIVHIGEQEHPVDDYNVYLYGKMRQLSVQNIRNPVLVFPYFTDHATKKYKEAVVCGQYYFFRDEQKVNTIHELSSQFYEYVENITFSGFLLQEYGVIGMIAVNDNMYTSNVNGIYAKVGKKTDFVPENMVSIFYKELAFYLIDVEGNLYHADVTFNSDLVPKITVLGKTNFEQTVQFLHPTCCSLFWSQGKATYTYINKDASYITMDYKASPVVVTSGEFNVESSILGCTNGSRYEYSLLGNPESQRVAMPTSSAEIQDTVPYLSESKYNDQRLLTLTKKQSFIWNAERSGFDVKSENSTAYTYVYNTSLPYAQAAGNAIGLLDSVTESIQENNNGTLSTIYLNKLHSTYNITTDEEKVSRLVYKSMETSDDLTGDKTVVTNEVINYTEAGQPELMGSVKPAGPQDTGLVSSAIYSKTIPDLLIASFDGVTYRANKRSCGYSGFGEYEVTDLTEEGKVKTPYFIFDGAELRDSGLLEGRSAYFKNGGKVILSDNIYLFFSDNVIYALTFYMKTGKGEWKYREIIKTANEMPGKVVTDIPGDTYINFVAFREVSNEVKIYVYDACGYRLHGVIDTNGVPTIAELDQRGRTIYSYIAEIQPNASGDKEFTGQFALNQMEIQGYARFGGKNRTTNRVTSMSRFNTVMQLSFRKNAKRVPVNTEVMLENHNLFYVMGKGALYTEVANDSDILSIRLSCSRLEVFLKGKNICSKKLASNRREEDVHWAFGLKSDILFIMIDGALDFCTVVHDITFNKIRIMQLGGYHANLGTVILAEDFDISAGYYDYYGRIVQSQSIRQMYGLSRLILEAYWYNRSNQVVARSLKGAYPIDKTTKLESSDHPLSYRDNFAVINWTKATAQEPRGILSGELSAYYQNGVGKETVISETDYQYPYDCSEYVTGVNKRLKFNIQPGGQGSLYTDSFHFHDQDSYNAYAKNYNPLNINYGSAKNKIYINGNNAEMSEYRLFDSDAVPYGAMITSTLSTNYRISYDIRNAINTDKLPNMSAIGETYYDLINREAVASGEYQAYYNRIQVSWGMDYGLRVLLKDVSGNGRLMLRNLNTQASYAIYFKYDKRNRLVESGLVYYNKDIVLQDLMNAIENPYYPTPSSDGVKLLSTQWVYKYDMPENGSSLGKLCRTISYLTKVTKDYYYDYLGRINKIQTSKNGMDVIMTQTVKKDNLSNILSIGYEEANSTLTYNYLGNEPVRIIYEENGKARNVLDEASYDIYERLLSYKDVNNILIQYAYDILGRQIYIGEQASSEEKVGVEKNYTVSSGQYQRVESLYYKSEAKKISLEYNPFLQLSSMEGAEGKLSYDNNGNLTRFTAGDKLYTVIYYPNSNKVQYVQDQDKKNAYEFQYNAEGLTTKISVPAGGYSFSFTTDQLYTSKARRLERLNASGQSIGIVDCYFGPDGRVYQKVYNSGQYEGNYYYYNEEGDVIGISLESGGYKNIFVNVGRRLIAQLNKNDNTWVGLCYDDSRTLRVATWPGVIQAYHYNAWGTPMESDLSKANYYYMGMEYEKGYGFYNNDGAYYMPGLGILLSPIIETGAFTPYRQQTNAPIL